MAYDPLSLTGCIYPPEAVATGDVAMLGECQDEAVPVDLPGDVSSFNDCAADIGPIFIPIGACVWIGVT